MFHKAKLDVKTHHFCQRVFLFPDLISYIYFPPKVNSLLTSPGQVCSAMAKLGALEYFYCYYYCCFHFFYSVVPPLRKSKSINKNKTKTHQNNRKHTHTQTKKSSPSNVSVVVPSPRKSGRVERHRNRRGNEEQAGEHGDGQLGIEF